MNVLVNKSRNLICIALAGLTMSACALPSAAQVRANDQWWSDPEIVSAVIVDYLDLRSRSEEVAKDAAFGSNVINLLLLFDGRDDVRSREALASLGSYYLGAHGGETYSCVVVRQGRAILPDLEKQITMKSTACEDRLGDRKGVCIPEQSRVSKLRALVARIEAGESCTVEK